MTDAEERLRRIDQQVTEAATAYEEIVARYAVLRCIGRLSALTLHAEFAEAAVRRHQN